ncbi:MAG: nitrous oxide reductase accessory protein NosL, partial [Bacillus sp. (in: firmicutes)]
HDMGSFTAQGVTEDGEHVFFDDSGCLLNYERKTGTELAASWVRDYQTDEWVEADDTVVVKSDIATPMKYGYAFFSNQEEADAFIAGHADLNAELVTWDDVDAVSNERYMKKMQKMNKDDSTEEMDMSTEEKDMNTEETESHTNE